MRRESIRTCAAALMIVTFVCASPASAVAQLNTQHIKGTVGLKGGSQPPPHWYLVAPLFYNYNTDTVKNADGDQLPRNPNLTSMVYAGGISKVTSWKLFGGSYGFQVLFPVGVNNRLQGTEIDLNPGAGLSDSVIQPINLGWHFDRADVLTGYTLFVPTGRYTDGASDNTGLGMWGHEFSLGTTVYLTESRKFHAATMASFDFQSTKRTAKRRSATR